MARVRNEQAGNVTVVDQGKKTPAKSGRSKTERLLDPAKANPVGRPFVEWLADRSIDAKLAALALDATEGARNELLYDGDLTEDLRRTWTADIDAAADRGELTEEQEVVLANIRLLLQVNA